MKVYQVWGLGFGDDEDAWVLCSQFDTQEKADAERAAILKDTDLLPEDVRVVEDTVN